MDAHVEDVDGSKFEKGVGICESVAHTCSAEDDDPVLEANMLQW